jgi:predicted nucleotidyltransferase
VEATQRLEPEERINALLETLPSCCGDLLFALNGLDPKAYSRAIEVPFHDKTLRLIGREDFIAMKAFAGRAIDLMDAARAITAAGDSLEFALVRKLAKRFGREASECADRLLKA